MFSEKFLHNIIMSMVAAFKQHVGSLSLWIAIGIISTWAVDSYGQVWLLNKELCENIIQFSVVRFFLLSALFLTIICIMFYEIENLFDLANIISNVFRKLAFRIAQTSFDIYAYAGGMMLFKLYKFWACINDKSVFFVVMLPMLLVYFFSYYFFAVSLFMLNNVEVITNAMSFKNRFCFYILGVSIFLFFIFI